MNRGVVGGALSGGLVEHSLQRLPGDDLSLALITSLGVASLGLIWPDPGADLFLLFLLGSLNELIFLIELKIRAERRDHFLFFI